MVVTVNGVPISALFYVVSLRYDYVVVTGIGIARVEIIERTALDDYLGAIAPSLQFKVHFGVLDWNLPPLISTVA